MDPDNMKFRLEDLTVDSILEDCGISPEEAKEIPPDIVKLFIEDFIPTKEDIRQPINEENLKELCKRVKCRALMYRWNPVHDYVRRFEREGRLQRWSPQKRLKLLTKAVNRYKDDSYTEEEICLQREREWCERKKENLMRLKVWEYDRQRQQQQPIENQEDVERQEHPQTPNGSGEVEFLEAPNRKRRRATLQPPTQSANVELTLRTPLDTLTAPFNKHPQIMTQVYALPQPVAQLQQQESQTDVEITNLLTSVDSTVINRDLLRMRALQLQEELDQGVHQTSRISNESRNETNNHNETQHRASPDELDAATAVKEVVQTQSIQFQLLSQENMQPFTTSVPNAPALPDVQDFININTESMSITETPLDSENLFSDRAEFYSEENTPPYTEFDNHISLTSTQSQNF